MTPILIDTSVWIDFTRSRSPQPLKHFIAPYILDPAAHLAEPIMFEMLRHASPAEARQLTEQFATYPSLPTPATVWTDATVLGQRCRKHGLTIVSLDLLIASVALHHGATLVTFDEDFNGIGRMCDLQVKLLRRPG